MLEVDFIEEYNELSKCNWTFKMMPDLSTTRQGEDDHRIRHRSGTRVSQQQVSADECNFFRISKKKPHTSHLRSRISSAANFLSILSVLLASPKQPTKFLEFFFTFPINVKNLMKKENIEIGNNNRVLLTEKQKGKKHRGMTVDNGIEHSKRCVSSTSLKDEDTNFRKKGSQNSLSQHSFFSASDKGYINSLVLSASACERC